MKQHGPVAQWLAQGTHNRSQSGSKLAFLQVKRSSLVNTMDGALCYLLKT